MTMKARYTVRRISNEDRLFGPSHASEDSCLTLCGKKINWKWYITHNDFDGEVTCKQCLRSMEIREK